MTHEELQALVKSGEIQNHHTSLFRGYVRRRGQLPEPAPYSGKFGKGFVTVHPNWSSKQYSYVTYYTYPKGVRA